MKYALLVVALAAFACSQGDERTDAPAVAAAPDTGPRAPVAQPAPAGEPGMTPAPPEATSPAPGGPAAAPAPRGPAAAPATPPQAPSDSATAILERASAKYAALRSLQADFTMTYENPLLRSKTTGSGVLYQKRPDRLLLRFSDPAGDIILSDGQYFWIYYPSVDREQVLRSPAAEGGASGVDLQAQFLGDPTRRFNYTLDGEESVGGRRAAVLTMTPKTRMGYRKLRVWIDRQDALARRFEITEDNGSVRRFELRNVKLDAAIGDGTFRFQVPAGARVITR